MIESNIIEWLEFGDSAQVIDIYSQKKQAFFFRFLRLLVKNKNFPIILYIILIIISFVQIWTLLLINVTNEKEFIVDILDYLQNFITLFQNMQSAKSYKNLFISLFVIILLDLVLILFALFSNKKMNTSYLCIIINLFNIIIYYYLIGPAIDISLTSIWCEDNVHKYLKVSCFSNKTHLIYTILSFIMLIIYILIMAIYSFYCNEIDKIKGNSGDETIHIQCNYDIFFFASKASIFIFGFFFRKIDYEEENHFLIKIIYESYIFIICLIMSIYTYKNVYFYNTIMNNINHFGWYWSTWFSLGIILNTLLNLIGYSNFISVGWIIITYTMNKIYALNENVLLTKTNIFEFNNKNLIEKYKNILLKNLSCNYNNDSKIYIFGIIKKFEEFISSNSEINYQYQKLINDKYLIKKFNKENILPILSIIYIIYSFYSEKSKNKDDIILHMCYFIINKFNNLSYAIFLCSKLKSEGHKSKYNKYLLAEDIKEYLILKLNSKSKKETIRQVQFGSIILYNLYINLFKLKIYDAICNQIDYFDLLKNNVTTNKTTDNFLKTGENIFKIRKDIITIWEKIIKLNPFCDDCHGDFILYLETIIQDEILAREESKKYQLLKNNKSQEKYNFYHTMFVQDTSSLLLVDGYLSNGKIIYASPNFTTLFMYTVKELTSLNVDDLLPNVIQTFHKELIENAIKFSNIKNIFKEPKDSLLKNKIGGLINIKLYVKPVPNLTYGLIYFTYLQKIHESNFNILLDKDFKINGFTETAEITTEYTVNNKFNLSYNIIGNHIGIIIPDILTLLEFKNDEFNLIKKDCELKGNLYAIDKVKDLKNKIDLILDKIKNNENKNIDYKEEFGEDDDPQKIREELDSLINYYNNLNYNCFNIFYKVKLCTFLEGKYKYYKIFIHSNDTNENENVANTKIVNSNIIPGQKDKIIKMFIDEKEYQSENNNDGENNPINSKEKMDNGDKVGSNQKNGNENEPIKEKKSGLNDLSSLASKTNNRSNLVLKEYNKIKIDIIKNKETFPLKMMKYLCYIFGVVTIILMCIEFSQQQTVFTKLNYLLGQYVFFEQSKLNIAILYSICVHIRWLSHSLYMNSKSQFNGEWNDFYEELLNTNLETMVYLKNNINSDIEELQNIIYKEHEVKIYFYQNDKPEKYKFNLKNMFYYILNGEIKLMNKFSYYYDNQCKNISEELGINEVDLKNLIEQTYNFWNLNLEVPTIEDIKNEKKADKVLYFFPLSFVIYGIILLFLLSFFIYYILSLFKVVIFFLDKLINFNSTDFENYLKKLDEIKKKLRNDTTEEDEKGDDIDLKDEDEGEGNENIEKKRLNEKQGKTKNKKKDKDKKLKLQQQRKKKLKLMTSFFRINVILFLIKIILILLSSLTYYILFIFIQSKNKNKLIKLYEMNESLDGVFKISYDIYLSFTRQLEKYEAYLINCNTIREFEEMDIPEIGQIKMPNLGNAIMEISIDSDLSKESRDTFNEIFSNNVCTLIMDPSRLNYCEEFWSGVLVKGLEQGLMQMNVIISSVIDELKSLNDDKNKTLLSLIQDSSFIEYTHFSEFYLYKIFSQYNFVIYDFRQQKLNSIIKLIKLVTIIYIIISLFLFILLIYFVYSFNSLFNSFLNFIGIFPPKYICEEEYFYKEIIDFGEKYF